MNLLEQEYALGFDWKFRGIVFLWVPGSHLRWNEVRKLTLIKSKSVWNMIWHHTREKTYSFSNLLLLIEIRYNSDIQIVRLLYLGNSTVSVLRYFFVFLWQCLCDSLFNRFAQFTLKQFGCSFRCSARCGIGFEFDIALRACEWRRLVVLSAIEEGAHLMYPILAFVALDPLFFRRFVIFHLLQMRFFRLFTIVQKKWLIIFLFRVTCLTPLVLLHPVSEVNGIATNVSTTSTTAEKRWQFIQSTMIPT